MPAHHGFPDGALDRNPAASAIHQRRTIVKTDTHRSTALIVGFLFVLTLLTGIGEALLYGPVIDDPGYVLGPGRDGTVLLGAVFGIGIVITNVATSLILYPLLRRHNETLALGYVAARLIEAALIVIGIVAVLSVVSLRQHAAGADPDALRVASQTLVTINRWTFTLGPGVVAGIGNGLILGWLMLRSGLVPRSLALLGVIGGPVLALSGVAVVLGVIGLGSTEQALATVADAVWEIGVMGVYLIVKGFRAAPILVGERNVASTTPAYAAA
jgi:hypothetical protein